MESKNLRPDIVASTAAALLQPVAVVAGIAAGVAILQSLIREPSRKNFNTHRSRLRHSLNSHWLHDDRKKFLPADKAATPSPPLVG